MSQKIIPCEADLSSESPERFAAAVLKCNSGYPEGCWRAGECAFGGCFEPVSLDAIEADKRIDELKTLNNQLHVRQTQFLAGIERLIAQFDQRYKNSKRNQHHATALASNLVLRELNKLKQELEQTA